MNSWTTRRDLLRCEALFLVSHPKSKYSVQLVHKYPGPPELYPLYASTCLRDRLELNDLPPELEVPINKVRTRYEVTFASLGLYGADLYLYLDLKHRVGHYLAQADEHAEYPIPNGANDTEPLRSKKISPELLELQAILDEYQPFFDDPENPHAVPINVDLNWCSPKLRLLADLLVQYYATTFQGIVFVEQRHVAACLAKMLPRIRQLEHYIRSGQLIGHGASNIAKSQVRGMALRTQQDVVKLFRENTVNLRKSR